jgi:hypothetical protein
VLVAPSNELAPSPVGRITLSSKLCNHGACAVDQHRA